MLAGSLSDCNESRFCGCGSRWCRPDSTTVKVYPDGTGALKKRTADHWALLGRLHHQDPSGCRACSVRPELQAVLGPAEDAPEGHELVRAGGAPAGLPWIAPTRATTTANSPSNSATSLSSRPIQNTFAPWEYDRVAYRRRNEVERLFRRLKGFRRVFSRYDKLDVMFAAFVLPGLIVDASRISVNAPWRWLVRFMIFDGAVVGIVDLVSPKRTEESTDVVDAAPRKPQAGDNGD